MTRLELFWLKTMWGNFKFDYACSMAHGRSGGLISMWDPNTFSKEEIWCDDSFTIVKGRWKNSVGICFMINVYSPQDSQTKSALWNKLADFMHNHNGKFILFGDLNVVCNEQERFGSIFSSHEADHFNVFIDSSCLIDLPIGGCYYTWMNKAGTKLSKLDRFLISDDILEDIPDIRITALDRLWSDHTPILFHVEKANFGPSPFKLYNSWLLRDGFDDLIRSAWSSMENQSNDRSLMSHEKLRSIKGSIKQWYSNIKINDHNKRLEALNVLNVIDKKIDDGSANENDRENRIKLLQDIDNLDNLESHDLIQKAHIKWDIEGDENSKFFHGIINQKRRSQSITDIMHDGTWITDPSQIKDAFLNFFKEKFQAHDSHIIFSPLVHFTGLCPNDRDFLETHVTLEEVKSAVWDCGSNKAPSPDGFSFAFVKKYWDLLKKDIFKFVDSFLAFGMMPQGANSSFFTLILKVGNPIHIKDFRPISLTSIHYKIIAKILANRLSKVIDKIVSKEQSAFIAGRQILDGPLILSEVINWFKKIKKKMVIFKVDFEKAFDSVSWNPTFEISIKRGLRQGDPLSPFLFILVMEGLHYAMSNAVSSDLIRGIKIGSSDITLSHFFYADDVIITTDWNFRDLDNIIRVFHVFYLASGLKINIHKSNIFGIGVPNGDVDMARQTGCASGIFSFTYLGLPIGSNMNLVSSWQFLINRFHTKLSSWKDNLLSIGRRLTLIKAVLGSIGIYFLSIFKVPETVLKYLERYHAKFIWGGSQDSRKLAWIKWLFRLDPDKDCLIIDRISNGQWKWNWSRKDIGVRNKAYLRELLLEISLVDIIVEKDSCVWDMAINGIFSVGDTRRLIDVKILPTLVPPTSWDKILPRKVNIFIWRLALDRLPHRLNLSAQGIDIASIACPSCNGNMESSYHIFLDCDFAKEI
ncbi:putative RNA-directed DNA polymerase, eukaryota, reverse transcriptase zinc-binding domain protein [Tanacetum coccineum]|uniref:RNA-directed DNA polymerase, eukaryota, reverse transcriptase zinc-binding domain protein n=1 Tax=Tanacetum coccineum TaxID=301880 RepID=A0ABQ4XMG5_9ASTR